MKLFGDRYEGRRPEGGHLWADEEENRPLKIEEIATESFRSRRGQGRQFEVDCGGQRVATTIALI